jgi:PleD family two-component response regulator
VEGGQEFAMLGDGLARNAGQPLSEHRALGLCRLLQQDDRLKHVPLLVVVDHHRPGIDSAFQLMGASEVIHKPITSDALTQGITRARQNSLVRGEA